MSERVDRFIAPHGAGVTPPRTSGLAVGALVCGIVGLLVCGSLLGPVAVALGRQARRDIRRTGDVGDGMAIAAIVMGWTGFGAWLVALVVIALAGFIP